MISSGKKSVTQLCGLCAELLLTQPCCLCPRARTMEQLPDLRWHWALGLWALGTGRMGFCDVTVSCVRIW